MKEGRSPLRFLAPVALALFAVAFFAVVAGSRAPGEDRGATATRAAGDRAAAGQADSGRPSGNDRRVTRRRTYRVKPGDTLGDIAEKTGVSVERLQELNPNLDPQALATGQKLKLRE